jgi:hypothetical protein
MAATAATLTEDLAE